MKWQPISTAPRDGTWVLLCGGEIDYGWCEDTKPAVVVGQCCIPDADDPQDGWQFAWYDSGYYGEYEKPTHWMPLPELPTGEPA